MTQEDINQLLPYFHEPYSQKPYVSYFLQKEIPCKKYTHKEHDNFQIAILEEEPGQYEVYQTNTDHEIWGIELYTFEDLVTRFRSFTGAEIEDIIILN